MTKLFKPKQIYNLDLDIDDDVSNQEDKITWNLNVSNPVVLSKNARIVLNEVKAKNTSTNYIKLYGSSFLDDTDAYDSAYKSANGCLLYTIPFTSSPFIYPDTNMIAYYTFNYNFNDSSGNDYNLDTIPYDNSHYTWESETINATTTTFLIIGDEITFPSINQIPNIYNIASAGNHTIDFSTAGSIDLKLNGNSVLPSGFVKNGYPVLKQLLPVVAPIQPLVWYKFDVDPVDGGALPNYGSLGSAYNANMNVVSGGITRSTGNAKPDKFFWASDAATGNYISIPFDILGMMDENGFTISWWSKDASTSDYDTSIFASTADVAGEKNKPLHVGT